MSDSRFNSELPISLECGAPIVEEFPYQGHLVSVSRKHCTDKMGPDENGYYEFYYDYEMFEFSLGTTTLLGRAYTHDREEAHLTGVEIDGERKLLTAGDLQGVLVQAAVQYFRSRGKTQLDWLDPSNELSGYSPIP